jgi:hypothetical protein
VDSDSKDSPHIRSPDLEPPAIVTMTARAYQLEMLEESLQQNIIVAVCLLWRPTLDIPLTYFFRWTLAVERLRCKSSGRSVSQSHANNSFRAILRIQAELEKSDKVSLGPQLAQAPSTDHPRLLGSWPRRWPWPTSSLRSSELKSQASSPS